MGEGYVGQIFNSIQGEGLYVGRRQVFVRFAGCSLDCQYCDSEEFRQFQPPACEVETKPSSMKIEKVRNPMTHSKVIGHVKRLATPDTHSVSLTGGEPLNAGEFLSDVAKGCKRAGLATYLETNGASSKAMRGIVRHIDIAAIDIKLPEHLAVPKRSWPSLLAEELSCIELSLESGVKTFVKIVLLPSTPEKTMTRVCKELKKIGEVPLVLQPVTPARGVGSAPPMTHVYRLSQAAARAGIKEVAIIPQVHKIIGVF
ncbi:MAG: 7-carboxy-7-deazaguanine synthase QueE [Methanobacteriota archaeon]